MPGKAAETGPIYQLKVTLLETKPPIWRRIEVGANTTLPRLHAVIQVAMGWTDSHLHRFFTRDTEYGEPDPDFETDMRSERGVRLAQIAVKQKDAFGYEYDFGDSWNHRVVVENILPPDPAVRYPRCVAGMRACPPEDVGGVWGYGDFLDAIGDPAHPEHDDMLEWCGGAFDPEAFSLEEVNQALTRLR